MRISQRMACTGWVLGLFTAANLLQAEVPKAVQDGLAHLKAAENYSWTQQTEISGFDRNMPAAMGKASKDGWAHITQEAQDNRIEVVRKGTASVVKTADGWQKVEALPAPGGGGGPGGRQGGFGPGGGGRGAMAGMMGRRLATQPVPAEQLAELASKAEGWKEASGLHTATLPPAALQNFALRGGRGGGGGGGGGTPPDAKGQLKLWVQEGQIQKAEIVVDSRFGPPGGESREMQTINTIQFKDVGKTELKVPEEARKLLAS